MKKRLLLLLLPLFIISCSHHSDLKRPKLVVGIVIDQMRYDYLYKYWDKYGDGGFKRLLKNGFSCEHTMIGYVPTYTGPGHAAIYTGCGPAVNGIVANDWCEVAKGSKLYCVEDTTVSSVGVKMKAEGKMSPRNLYTTTITDELRYSNNFHSKVIGISLKDRGSILPAGHTGRAYWYEGASGNFISSTYYGDSLPAWVNRFNNKKLPEKYLSSDWNTMYPINTYTESTADDMDYEGTFNNEAKPVFPHKLASVKGDGFDAVRSTPWGNTLLMELAKDAIDGEELGKREVTDFLAVSFSSTDYVGHRYGPDAIETEDTYLRMDKDLAEFLDYLDKKLGKENVLVFLTADHGAAQNPKYLSTKSVPAGAFPGEKFADSLKKYLALKYDSAKLVTAYMNQQVYLNHKLIEAKKLNYKEIEADVIAFSAKMPGVSSVISATELTAGKMEGINGMIKKGYNKARSGDVVLTLFPAWFDGKAKGTTHGSAYPYDTHIPLLWYGWHIKPGSTNAEVEITDIAPTLAGLLHIQMPDGADGRPIQEILKEKKSVQSEE